MSNNAAADRQQNRRVEMVGQRPCGRATDRQFVAARLKEMFPNSVPPRVVAVR